MKLKSPVQFGAALKIVLIYALISSVWILVSDRLLQLMVNDPIWEARLQTLKGWGFVFVTSLLLHYLIQASQRKVRQSSQLLQSIVDGTTDAIFVKDRQGRFLLVNGPSAEILQHPAEKILGKYNHELLPPDVAQTLSATDQSIMASGQPQQLQEVVPINGENHIFWSNKYVWRNEHGQVQGLIGMTRDITQLMHMQNERQKLIADLQKQTQELQALNLVTANAISTLDLDELLDILLERILSVTQADIALILLVENQALKIKASKVKPGAMADGQPAPAVPYRQERILGEGFAGTIFRTHHPLYVENIHQDARFSTLYQDQPQTCSLLGVPRNRYNQCLGVLQLEWLTPHSFEERELHLLEITAERCAMAILNAQLYARLERLNRQLQIQIDRMPTGLLMGDENFHIVDWNPAATKIFGFTKAEVLGRDPRDLIVPASAHSTFATMSHRLVRGDMSAHSTHENITKTGQLIFCEWHNTPLFDKIGQFIGVLSMVQDVTERKRTQEQLERLAYYDSLTGLPRRPLLLSRLKTLMESPARQGASDSQSLFAVFYIECHHYGRLKYSLGHDLADALLVAIARRSESCLLSPAIIAHVETDEFTILLEQLTDSSEAISWAETVLRELRQPLSIQNHQLFISPCLGIALSSQAHANPEAMVKAADVAMNHVKSMAQNWAIYDPAMADQAIRVQQLDTDLRLALERQQFELHYQPIFQLQTHQLLGFEALLRWHHPDRGMVSPSEFIPTAEQSGMILPIGEWVLQQACQQCQRWQEQWQGDKPLAISVNLSAQQMQQPNLLAQIEAIAQRSGLRPEHLKLEITESLLVESTPQITSRFERLRDVGFQLIIDDFGTGYSCLSYLHQFPFDGLKLDRSFVSRLGIDHQSETIIRTLMQLANNLHMAVVAEGIETLEQLNFLKQLNCSMGQGYFFSRPMDAVMAEQFITLQTGKNS
jgi:PAS domain S-box-containing protein/diguanylate cyclase (GGDEF)-like protein